MDAGDLQAGFRALMRETKELKQEVVDLKEVNKQQLDVLHIVSSKMDIQNEWMLGLVALMSEDKRREYEAAQELPFGPDVPCPKCDSVSVTIPDETPHIRECRDCKHVWQFRPDADVPVSDVQETEAGEQPG